MGPLLALSCQTKPFNLYTPSTDSPHTRARTTETITRVQRVCEHEGVERWKGDENSKRGGEKNQTGSESDCSFGSRLLLSLHFLEIRSSEYHPFNVAASPLDSVGSSLQSQQINQAISSLFFPSSTLTFLFHLSIFTPLSL